MQKTFVDMGFEVKKKKKKKGERQQFDRSCLWNDRQKGDNTSKMGISLQFYSLSVVISWEEMATTNSWGQLNRPLHVP